MHKRFLWFVRELRKEINQNLEVSEIEKNAPPESEVDLVDEYFRNAPKLYTPESYDEISTELMGDILKPALAKFQKIGQKCPEKGKP